MIYLDYNATAPLRPAVQDAMTAAMQEVGNPSSVHQAGVAARRTVTRTRALLAEAVGAQPHQVYFTSGGTEANAMVLASFADKPRLVCATDHASVVQAPGAVATIPVDGDGLVDRVRLEQLLDLHQPALVSVMLVNNETGVIQDLPAIAKLCHAKGADVHCDAVQAFGKLPLDFLKLGADFMTLGAHKVGGPLGIGAVVTNHEDALQPLLYGGSQENQRRAGTENVIALAGLRALLGEIGTEAEAQRLQALQTQLESGLPEAVIIGQNAPRVSNTSCLSLPGMPAVTQVMAFDLDGIAVSAGSACSSGKVTASPVLQAMGLREDVVAGAIRLSYGWQTTPDDIDAAIKTWKSIFSRCQVQAA